jgi:hypothetical protein
MVQKRKQNQKEEIHFSTKNPSAERENRCVYQNWNPVAKI